MEVLKDVGVELRQNYHNQDWGWLVLATSWSTRAAIVAAVMNATPIGAYYVIPPVPYLGRSHNTATASKRAPPLQP